MKTSSLTPRTAHVGYTETEEDYLRMTRAESWLSGEDDDTVDTWSNGRSIDLSTGEDFLAQNERYEVVVLHRIYDGVVPDATGVCKTSAQHSPKAWSERLVATGARFIFTFGGTGTEVDYRILGELPGYYTPETLRVHRDATTLEDDGDVYVKRDH